MQQLIKRCLTFAMTLGFGVALGLACKPSGGTQSAQGAGCPGSKPRAGARCPRGESAFCVYRNTGSGDYVCTCGGGKWGCGKK